MALTKEDQERIRNRWQNRNNGSSTTTTGGTSSGTSLLSDKDRERVKERWNNRFDLDETYINTFISDANSFLDRAQSDYNRLDYQSATADSSLDYYNSMRQTESDLSNRAWKIQNYLKTRKDDLDEETYNSMSSFLDNFSSPKFSQQFYDARDFYSQWESEDKYKEWQAKQKQYEADKAYDVNAGMLELEELKKEKDTWLADQKEKQKQEEKDESIWESIGRWLGTTPDTTIPLAGATDVISNQRPTNEYDKRISELEDQIERAKYVQGYEGYMANMNAEGYDGQYVSTRTGVAMDDATYYVNYGQTGEGGAPIFFQSYDTGKLFGDFLYDYINKNPDALAVAKQNDVSDSSIFMGLDKGFLQTLTEDEIGVYNSLYKLDKINGTDNATEFLRFIESDLKGRKRAQEQEYWAAYAKESPFGSSVFSTLISPLKGVSYVAQAADMLDDGKLEENAGYNRFSYIPSTIRSTVSDTIEKSWGGKVGSFAYNTGMSMADFLFTTAVSGGNQALSLGIMGSGAAADATLAAKKRGLEDGEAFALGTIAGIAEVAMEKISLSAWLEGDMTEGALRYVLKNAFSEGGEEAGTSLVNLLADVMISGDKSEWNMAMQAYIDQGKSPQEAFGLVAAEQAAQIGLDALGGMLSGFAIGGGTYAGKSIVSAFEYKNTKKDKQFTNNLVTEGLELNPDSQYIQKAKTKLDNGKNLTGMQVRNILAANQEKITANDMQKIQTAAEQRLTSLGETKDVGKLAEIATKWATGQDLNPIEKRTLTHSEYGSRVANELLPKNIQSGDYSTGWAENIGTKQINKEAYNKELFDKWRAAMDEIAKMDDPATYKPLEERVGEDEKLSVSKSGQATIRKTGDAISLDKVEVAEFITDKETGKIKDMVLKADGQTVKASEIDYADDSQSYLFAAVPKIENITPADAQVIIRDYDPASGLSVSEYLNGVDEAFTYGYHGYSEADLKAGYFTTKLTDTQVKSAYALGQNAQKNSDEASDAPRIRMRTDAEAKLSNKEKVAQQKARFESGDAEVYFMDGKSVVKFDEHTGEYDDKRMAGVNTAKFLNKLGIGGKYYFYESYEKDGVRVYKDANGNEVEAPNGIYKSGDGSIYIDLNAGDVGQGTVLYTLGHELLHFVKDQSKRQFKILSDLVTEAYDKTDMSMHERVLAKQKFLSEKRGEAVSYTEAHEEVVADAMSTMLSDGSFYEKLMEIKAKDKGLFNTIKRFFENMIAKFTKAYEELTPELKDARDIQSMKDMFDKIQTAFAEALVEASDNFHVAEAQKNTTEDGGVDGEYDIKLSPREENAFKPYAMAINAVINQSISGKGNIDGKIQIKEIMPTGPRITAMVAASSGDAIDISQRSIALNSSDIWHEYKRHTQVTQEVSRDQIAFTKRQFQNAVKCIISPDMVETIFTNTNNPTQRQSFAYAKKTARGHYVVVEAVGGKRSPYICPVMILQFSKAKWDKMMSQGKTLGEVLYENDSKLLQALDVQQNKKSRVSAAQFASYEAIANTLRSSQLDTNIAQPEAEVKSESAEALDVEVDAKTESVAPAVLKSERTWKESDYVQERNKAAKEIAKAIGVTEQKARDYIDSVNSIAKMIAEDRSRLDYFSSPGRSSFVDNAEYGGSFDFSTLCKKRRLLTGTFTAIQKALPNTALTADEILDIRNRMKKADLEVSCGLCYVEGSRANMGQFAKEFLRLYKQYYPDAWQPNMADVNTPDGIEWVRLNHPECYEQYEYFWNHYGTLKDGDKNLFASQQKPKLYQLHTEYKGEILNKFKVDDKVEDKNLNGGIRLQSFSDFEIVHLIDTMQIIMDMSRVGLAGQAYTKVPDFAWALGDTGLKINLSLIAKGVDENGKLIFDDVEGMPIADAMKLRDRYSKNVGTILVAFNDEQLLAAMADDRVDFIIPFHRSQWKKSQYEAMGLPAKTKDYTFMQNEKFIKPQFHEYRGRMVKDKATNYMPNEYWDFSKSGKENAEAYLEMCARNNKRPKFYKLLQNNGDGSYSLKADGSTDGYWKLLIDFKMYDNEGNGSPQMAVKPDFNMEEATRMLNDYSGGHSNFPVAQGIVDDFVNEYKESHKGQKFSMRNTVESTNDLLAFHNISEKLLWDALKQKGLVMPSLAVTNKGMDAFGEISLLFDKSVIDPAVNKDNKLYGADAWTPMQTTLKMNAKFDTNKTVNAVNTMKDHIGSKYVSELLNITPKQFKEAIIKADGNIYEAYAHNIGVQTAYAMEKGIISQIPANKDGTVNQEMLQKQLDKTLDTDDGWRQYRRWLNNISDTVITSYDQASNEDVLRHMKAQPATAKTFKLSETGELVVPAKEYASIKELRRNKNRLSENAEEATKSVAAEFMEFAKKIGDTQQVVEAINAGFEGRYNIADIMKAFSNNGVKISSKEAGELQALYKKAVELPTKYFEAKPGGEVGIDKINTAVVPLSVSAELRKVLKELGINVVEYNGTKESRVQAMNSVESVKFSERGDGTSNRSLLANAFEGITQNSKEYEKIQEYKGRIKILNEYEEKLAELNSEIRKMLFDPDTERDAKKLKELQDEAKKVRENINRNDKKLLSLEASKPLRDVIDRERKKESQKTKAHVKQLIKNKKERAEQTELRHKIRKTVRDLDKIMKHGNKQRNVKEDMKGFVSTALDLADYLFTDHISNDDLIRRGIDAELIRGEKEAQLVKETEEILTKLYDEADSLTDEEFTRLDEKRKANEAKLKDLLTAQRNKRLSTPVYNLFNDLVTEYASLKNSKQDAVKAAYNEELENSLRAFISEDDRVKILKNMRVADMTTEELNWLYRAYTMVLNNVRNANKFHAKGMTESIEQVVGQIAGDFSSREIPEKKLAIAAQKLANKIGWDYEKLYYALDRIGSDAFTKLIMNLADSENIVMQDIIEAAEFRDEIVKNYGFNNWDVNKKIDKEFMDNTGKKFTMTLGELMSLYAYSRREGAWDHIEYGGFVFGEKALTNPKPADSYKLSKEQCEAITSLLTKEQKGYVEDMQKFLSKTMGEKGNEVSMMLYGIKMFGEKNYFPIHIAGQFKAQANESQAKAAAGFQSMSNAGFTHAQNPNAKAPFVLEGFNEVWADHVNEMSRYHGTVPALEDLRRVMNRSTYSDSVAESQSIKQLMENHYGEEAVKYFDNLYREANSGAITDKLQNKPKKLLSLFRKNSVAYSLSVLVQQPASLVRAYAMVDRKYFGFKGFGAITSGVAKAVSSKWNPAYANAYNEMLKYAPGVTMAKQIGGFDTATGGSIRSYLLDTGKSLKQKWKTGTAMEKGKAILDVVDDNAIANLPNVADKIAWIEIWNACKRETVAKHKDLAPTSEEFMKIVGDRFTEVIRATQVYDSIFAKSPMLKSKNLAVQYLVSFMNEPNTVANMTEKAMRDITKGNKADVLNGLKAAHVVIHSIIFTNLLKSMIYALRDDDEDETYIEKYIEAITGNMMDDLWALNYIPIARDAWSIAQGYDVERADMAIVSDAVGALNNVFKNAAKNTEDMTEEELIEFDKKVTETNWQLVESLAAFLGIPVKNIRREINGLIDHAKIASANAGMTNASTVWDTISEAVIDSIPFMSNKETKNDKLYDAIVTGDTAYVGRLKSTYKDEAAYNSAVRKALRENDSRILAAAQARYDGNMDEYKRIFREIQGEGNFTFDEIMDAVNSEVNAIKNKLEPDKVTSTYSASDFVQAVSMGDTSTASAAKDDIIGTHVANGKTQEEAEAAFVSSVKTSTHDAYSSGLLDEAGAKNMLMEYAGMDEEDADSMVNYWTFCEENPEYDYFSESNVNKYQEFAEPANISLEVYAQFVKGTKGLKNIKDEWGDVEKSVRDQKLEVIDSLPLTWEQKDALYLAADLAESKIWDVPW